MEDFIKLKPIHENLKKTRDQLHLETQRNHELSKDNNHLRMELEEKDRIIKALKKKINNNSRKDDIKDDDEDVNDEEEYENSDEVSDNKDEDN